MDIFKNDRKSISKGTYTPKRGTQKRPPQADLKYPLYFLPYTRVKIKPPFRIIEATK